MLLPPVPYSCRVPGACDRMSLMPLRPVGSSSSVSRVSLVVDALDETSTTGEDPETVTDSSRAPTFMTSSSFAWKPMLS